MAVFRCISNNEYKDFGKIVIGNKITKNNEYYIEVKYIKHLCIQHGWGKHGLLPMNGLIWKWEEVTFNKYLELCK